MSINSKSTKTEILEAYMALKEKQDAMEAMKDDPAKKAMAVETKRMEDSAKNIIESGILAPEIVQQYKDLETAIANKKAELHELYEIDVKANSMVVLINAYKDKEVELKEKYDGKVAELNAELAQKREAAQKELDELKAQKEELLESKKREHTELLSQLAKERARDKEQYDYDMKRARLQDGDQWADEKATREKLLADRENAVLARELAMKAIEDYVKELEAKVEAIPGDIEAAFEDGKKKGKAEADKSNAFEVRTLTMKNEYEQKALQEQVVRLIADLKAAREANEILQDKLDDSYKQMKELASETVKSSGGVKILDRENTGK